MSATETKFPPIMKVAAVSVIVFAMAGIGVMTGVLPSAFSKSADEQAALAAKACPNCGVVEFIKIVELKREGTGVGVVRG